MLIIFIQSLTWKAFRCHCPGPIKTRHRIVVRTQFISFVAFYFYLCPVWYKCARQIVCIFHCCVSYLWNLTFFWNLKFIDKRPRLFFMNSNIQQQIQCYCLILLQQICSDATKIQPKSIMINFQWYEKPFNMSNTQSTI